MFYINKLHHDNNGRITHMHEVVDYESWLNHTIKESIKKTLTFKLPYPDYPVLVDKKFNYTEFYRQVKEGERVAKVRMEAKYNAFKNKLAWEKRQLQYLLNANYYYGKIGGLSRNSIICWRD